MNCTCLDQRTRGLKEALNALGKNSRVRLKCLSILENEKLASSGKVFPILFLFSSNSFPHAPNRNWLVRLENERRVEKEKHDVEKKTKKKKRISQGTGNDSH